MKKILELLGIIKKKQKNDIEPRVHDFLYDIANKQWVYVVGYDSLTKHWFLSNGDECDNTGWSPYIGCVNYRSSERQGIIEKQIKHSDIVMFEYEGKKHTGYYEKYALLIKEHALEIRYFNVIKTHVL